jgi:hypothetical protein
VQSSREAHVSFGFTATIFPAHQRSEINLFERLADSSPDIVILSDDHRAHSPD